MIRILFGLGTLVAVTAIVAGGTQAFLSDNEFSTGNVLAAGALDLKVDNESYYNGALNDGTSWELADLLDGQGPSTDGQYLFFDFRDLKPDDEGEDTISLHIEDNAAWACMDIAVTSADENGCNEPEMVDGDSTCGDPGVDEGELQNEINLVWWPDDGDNVLEDDEAERIFSTGTFATLSQSLALADTSGSALFGNTPLDPEQTYYIGKAWCFGDLTVDPITQDGDGKTGSNGPLDRGTGIQCDGTLLDNTTQTDSVTGDIHFSAIQSRGNDTFDCRGDCKIDTELTLIPGSGFEAPEVTTAQDWDIFDSPAGAWQVAWRDDIPATYEGLTRPDPAHLEIHEGVVGTPIQGDQYAELDTDWDGPGGSVSGEPASVRIFQEIATIPGVTYEIRFAFAPRPNTPAADNRLEVRWDDTVVYDSGEVADPTPGIDWQEISIEVTAVNATTELAFTDLGIPNATGTFVDDIRLYREVCVPPDA